MTENQATLAPASYDNCGRIAEATLPQLSKQLAPVHKNPWVVYQLPQLEVGGVHVLLYSQLSSAQPNKR